MGHAHPGTDGVWGLCCGTSMCRVWVCAGLCCCVWGLQWALTAALDVCMCVCVCNAYEQMAALNYCHPALQAGPRCLCMCVCKCLSAASMALWMVCTGADHVAGQTEIPEAPSEPQQGGNGGVLECSISMVMVVIH